MAITRLNSLAIPAGTVEPADISYPLTNFSSTGIDDNAANTTITIDSIGNVGFGVAAAAGKLHVKSQGAVAGVMETTGTESYISFLTTETTATNETRIGLVDDNEFVIKTGGSTAVTIDENQNVDIAGNLNLSVGTKIYTTAGIHTDSNTKKLELTNNANETSAGVSIVEWGYQHASAGFQGDIHYIADSRGASGKHRFYEYNGSGWTNLVSIEGAGVTFDNGGNYLDDYEEGTWTPTASTNVSAIANANGHYTKIGNLVTINFFADITPSASTQELRIGGLPYSVFDAISGSNVEATGIAFEDNNMFMFFALGDSSQIWIELDRPIQGSADTNNRSYRGSLTYMTT